MTFSLRLHSPFESVSASTVNAPDTINEARFVQYAILASLALQVYDYITTFEDEMRFVWLRRTPFRRRILFLLNRYLPFVTALSATYLLLFNSDQNICHISHVVVAEIALAGAIIAECTLFLRTCAIYKGNKLVIVVLTFLALVSAGGSVINTFYYADRSSIMFREVPHRGCLFWYRLKIEWVCLVALIFCESVAFCLVAVETVRCQGHSKSNILAEICKISIFYFICIIGSSIVNLLIQLFASRVLCDVLLIPQSVLHQILCTHFILRIRRISEEASISAERIKFEPEPAPDFYPSMGYGTVFPDTDSSNISHV